MANFYYSCFFYEIWNLETLLLYWFCFILKDPIIFGQNATIGTANDNTDEENYPFDDKEDDPTKIEVEQEKPESLVHNGSSRGRVRKRRDVFGDSSSIDDENQKKLDLEDLLNRKIYKKLTGHEILNMTHTDLIIENIHDRNNPALKLVADCNYSLVLNSNLEFYFKG